jgi:hypothetical protein
MSQSIFIGNKISLPALRDYIITHTINAGDTLVLNTHDFKTIIEELKHSEEGIPDFPLTMLGVIITQDSTDTIPIGKVQIVKNDENY